MSRHWHLSASPIFAFTLLFYMLWSLFGGHLGRGLAFRRGELAPRHVWQDIGDTARLRFSAGEAALRYNVLKKASNLAVLFVALTIMILAALPKSTGLTAALSLQGSRYGRRHEGVATNV